MPSPRPPGPTVTTGVFALLCGLAFLMYIDRSNISIAAPVIQKEFGFSTARLGWIFSAFATAYACCMLLGGRLADRIGPRLALTLYGLLWAVATIASLGPYPVGWARRTSIPNATPSRASEW